MVFPSGSGTAPGLLPEALGRPWGCCGAALGLLWLLPMLWDCPGAALGLLLARHQVRPFLRALCGCSGAALGLLVAALGLLWDCSGAALGMLLELLLIQCASRPMLHRFSWVSAI